MSAAIACLDLGLPEFDDWFRDHVASGYELRFLAADPDPSALSDVEYVIVLEAPVTRTLIEAAPRLRLIQLPQTGFDNIDVEAAARAGVPVANTPGLNATSVAEHTLMLILAAFRRLIDADDAVRRATWPQLDLFRRGIRDLRGTTVGLVGFGSVGQALAPLLQPFGVELLYHRRTRLPEAEERRLAATWVPLDELLARSDVLSLHVPLTPETRNLIGRREIGLMKPDAIIVNAARGGVLDEGAALEAVESGRLHGLALDVLQTEPPDAASPLLRRTDVVLTPHVASGSKDVAWRSFQAALDNVYRVAAGQAPANRVA